MFQCVAACQSLSLAQWRALARTPLWASQLLSPPKHVVAGVNESPFLPPLLSLLHRSSFALPLLVLFLSSASCRSLLLPSIPPPLRSASLFLSQSTFRTCYCVCVCVCVCVCFLPSSGFVTSSLFSPFPFRLFCRRARQANDKQHYNSAPCEQLHHSTTARLTRSTALSRPFFGPQPASFLFASSLLPTLPLPYDQSPLQPILVLRIGSILAVLAVSFLSHFSLSFPRPLSLFIPCSVSPTRLAFMPMLARRVPQP